MSPDTWNLKNTCAPCPGCLVKGTEQAWFRGHPDDQRTQCIRYLDAASQVQLLKISKETTINNF